ncbi:MAG: hypothetical protein ACREBD_02045 [Blastocatellia bacterium]
MNTNDSPDSTAPLPGSQAGDFEAFMRNTMSLIITRLDRIESQNANLKIDVDQLNKSVDQLNRDQHDRYVDLRLRLSTLDEKIDAHLREVVILKRDLRKLQEKVDPNWSA